MGVEIKYSQSYHWLNSWILGEIIYLATQDFCDRYVDFRIDPGRRLYDQMVMAGRSGPANIAEGSARHSTSIETEMRLVDVARGSFNELQGDYFNFLLRRRIEIWQVGDPNREAIWRMWLDEPQYSNSLLHDAAVHILRQKAKFDPWLECDDPGVVANVMLVLCERENRMLQGQLERQLDLFRQKGGFTENMTAERLDARREQAASEGSPPCPLCGRPMLRRTQKKGQMQGREFWGCSDYPRCNGTRRIEGSQG